MGEEGVKPDAVEPPEKERTETRPSRWRPSDVGGREPGTGRRPRQDWIVAAPALFLGSLCGGVATAVLAPTPWPRPLLAGALGLALGAIAFRALGLATTRRSPRDIRGIAAVLGGGAAVIVGRMLG